MVSELVKTMETIGDVRIERKTIATQVPHRTEGPYTIWGVNVMNNASIIIAQGAAMRDMAIPTNNTAYSMAHASSNRVNSSVASTSAVKIRRQHTDAMICGFDGTENLVMVRSIPDLCRQRQLQSDYVPLAWRMLVSCAF